jgi:hypothetical protein
MYTSHVIVLESGIKNNILLTAKAQLPCQNSPCGMRGGEVSLRTLRLYPVSTNSQALRIDSLPIKRLDARPITDHNYRQTLCHPLPITVKYNVRDLCVNRSVMLVIVVGQDWHLKVISNRQ